ncbi:hypothetical protein EG346_17115 [Chryseobacterium carnipullorum]|uniref:Uncharacterized protein n=1 Tax=Chryseobacterium carnipullorum TaxID=1124835 RepID=A0A376DV60_CHRCU|nr:hypothetical protein [Chryseobacterium carnipullorum]AZA49794.1 hypothetical protein EG346_17115 [Chryseobacterium carnipullorum]AZA64685.1 hypothetical protein EG345_08140 [Chryseobacterium carnipullorum]STC95758.1 Uncharacterised protein [Chryseobacterium carnipullorum]
MNIKEILQEVKIVPAKEYEESHTNYHDVIKLINQGYLLKFGGNEENHNVIVRISPKGNDYLKKN